MPDKQEPVAWRVMGHPSWQYYEEYGAAHVHELHTAQIAEPLYPASTISAKEAEIERLVEALEPFAEFARASSFDKLPDDIPLTNGSPMARKQVTAADFRRARAKLEKHNGRTTPAQSEVTHFRKGIQKLINGPYVEQTVDSILDRLKAILEEESTAGEATDLRERVSVLETLLHRAVEGPWSNSDLIHARKLLEAKTDG